PGMRGGHQMVIDCASDTIYLLGGWDGCSDLADFWKYNIESGRWTCISEDTAAEGGPGPRSCHRMVLDTEGQRIFILGKYIEPEARTSENVASDFYSYHIDSGSWNLLCEDTACYGGPQLIYEHQMVIDMERQIIYCFGGRILTISSVPADPRTRFFDSPIDSQFSGLYAYCIPTNTWRLLRDDGDNGDGIMRSRTGHSMLFCPVDRKLYVFAGQRNKQLLNDFVVYDADTNTACSVADDTGAVATIPSLGSTQRATIDSDKREIYVLSGTMKAKSKDTGLKNAFWVYRLDTAEWTCVFENENSAQTSRDTLPTREQVLSVLRLRKQQQLQQREPCPRYAHQIVYDPGRKLHYLFGGNPGTTKQTTSTTRLDDFWQLMLVKPTTDDILRNCRWKLRKRILMDLLKTDRVKAVEYLQREMSQVVNLKDPLETTKFQQLAHRLFTEPEKQADFLTVRDRNKALFSSIIRFFPVNTRPPVENLIDIIKL
uniref:Muskelin n=1 Tax=Plectus sambesii TaxID=2011161 RepID=A0A914UQZ7_9BILA